MRAAPLMRRPQGKLFGLGKSPAAPHRAPRDVLTAAGWRACGRSLRRRDVSANPSCGRRPSVRDRHGAARTEGGCKSMSEASKRDGEGGLLKDKRVRRAWSLYQLVGAAAERQHVRQVPGRPAAVEGRRYRRLFADRRRAHLGAVAVSKPDLLRGWLLPKTTVDVSTQKWADSSVVFPIDGVDKAGKPRLVRRAGADQGLHLGARQRRHARQGRSQC